MTEEPRISQVSLVKRNLRELGGLPTRESGVFVKRGHFFRSSSLSAFDPDEHRARIALDLGRVIDLRTDGELAAPRAAAIPTHIRVIHLPLFENARPNWLAPADQSPRTVPSTRALAALMPQPSSSSSLWCAIATVPRNTCSLLAA